MAIAAFFWGSIILFIGSVTKDKKHSAAPYILHFMYVPLASMIIGFFFDIKPIAGLAAAVIIFLLTLYLWIKTGDKKTWIFRLLGSVISEIFVTCRFFYWYLFVFIFYFSKITYTDFEPSLASAIVQEFYIKDNGSFTVEQITYSRDKYSLSVISDTTPEVFINELMDKEVYDTEQLYGDVQWDFEKDRERAMFGVVNADGTPFDSVDSIIVLSDYLKDPENDSYFNVQYGRVRVLFDEKEEKCKIYSSGDHLVYTSESAAADVCSRADTVEKKWDILTKGNIK